MIVDIVTIPSMFLVVESVFTVVCKLLGKIVMGMYVLTLILTGLFFGAFQQVYIMFRIRQALIPVLPDIVLREASRAFNPILSMGVSGRISRRSIRVFAKIKRQDKKELGYSTMTSALFGIIELSIFCITLAYRKPFIAAMISGGLSGMLCTVLGVNQYSPTTVSKGLTFGARMSHVGNPKSLISWFICFFVSFGLNAILIFFTTKPEEDIVARFDLERS